MSEGAEFLTTDGHRRSRNLNEGKRNTEKIIGHKKAPRGAKSERKFSATDEAQIKHGSLTGGNGEGNITADEGAEYAEGEINDQSQDGLGCVRMVGCVGGCRRGAQKPTYVIKV